MPQEVVYKKVAIIFRPDKADALKYALKTCGWLKEKKLKVFSHPKQTIKGCLLYTSPSPRDQRGSRMPSSA